MIHFSISLSLSKLNLNCYVVLVSQTLLNMGSTGIENVYYGLWKIVVGFMVLTLRIKDTCFVRCIGLSAFRRLINNWI